MSQVKAQDAISNMGSWLNLLGIDTKSFQFNNIDTFALWGGIVLFFGSIISLVVLKRKPEPRTPKIQIVYKENHPDYHQKHWDRQAHRINIVNNLDETIEGASIELTKMEPRHAVFRNLVPMVLEKNISLNPGDNFFQIVEWVHAVGQEYAIISDNGHTRTTFTVDYEGHTIKLTVRGKDLPPVSKSCKFYVEEIEKRTDIFHFKCIT